MRPDRIVVGECRGGEALDMLQAMNTGHDGSLTTIHANSPYDMIARLEAMVLMSGAELPISVIRSYIASAVKFVVQIARLQDGSRRVTAITEVLGLNKETMDIDMQDIFIFERSGVAKDGKVLGEFVPTGVIPSCYDEFALRGLDISKDLFKKKKVVKE
jgi:pilus assembly protein CpaF